ncbi:hypothetical protein [Micromonospora sp. NPDC092111]|uniref:hypothetical protein n=1 Tax=Micromonospora sp. NPDC092111 TaxID=3364289 RepID=UPI00380CA8EF
MKHPKLAAAGVALAALLAVGGCTSDAGDQPTPAADGTATGPAADAEPAVVLAAAARKVDEQSYRLTVNDGAAGDGTTLVWDPKGRRGLETTSLAVANGKVTIERLTTGADVYVKVTAPDRRVPVWDGRTWWHIGTAGKASTAATAGLDMTRVASTLSASGTSRRTGERAYAGTLDLRGRADVLGKGVDGVLGDRAAAVPFTAELDGQGRLVRYRLEVAAEQGRTAALDLTYADFGLPVSAEKPAAELIGEDPPGNIPGV